MVCDGEVDVCEDLQLDPGETESFYFTACPDCEVSVLAHSNERVAIQLIRLRNGNATLAAAATVPIPFGFGFRHRSEKREELIFRTTNNTARLAEVQVQIRVAPGEAIESSSTY
jgi:hypothetical protein